MAGDALRRTVKVDAVQPPATPRPSDRFGNAVPCGYAALEWSGSTWRIQVGLSNLPRITSAAATQHLSKRPLRSEHRTRLEADGKLVIDIDRIYFRGIGYVFALN